MAGDNKAEETRNTRDTEDTRGAKDTRSMADNSSSTVYDKMIKFLDEMDEEKFREKVSQAMVEVDRKKTVRRSKWIMIAGLLLSMVGTVLIWVDSQEVIKELSDAITLIVEPTGGWKDVLVDTDEITNFHHRMESALSLDKKGFVLLILGFVVQVVGVVVKGREA